MPPRYLFTYFTTQFEQDGEQVRFARSAGHDPLHWEVLNDGRPVLRWTGGRGGVRDPFVLRAHGLPGESAKFYLLGTDMCAYGRSTPEFWDEDQRTGSHSIVVWESVDLVTWSEPRLVEVSPPEAGNTWAPEATFDPDTGEYLVYWSSKLYESGQPRGESYNRILMASTRDFRVFSPARIWNDPGHAVIDATVVPDGDRWYRFTKDERTPGAVTPEAKFITVERSGRLTSSDWEFVADGVGRASATGAGLVHGEGPIVVAPSDEGQPWYLFIDEFGYRRYVPFVGAHVDTSDWRIAEEYLLPPGASHGSILTITEDEWQRLGDMITEAPAP